MKKPLLTGGAAKALEMSDDNVRLMEKRGLLHPERTASGVRLFDPDEVKQLAKDRAKKKKER